MDHNSLEPFPSASYADIVTRIGATLTIAESVDIIQRGIHEKRQEQRPVGTDAAPTKAVADDKASFPTKLDAEFKPVAPVAVPNLIDLPDTATKSDRSDELLLGNYYRALYALNGDDKVDSVNSAKKQPAPPDLLMDSAIMPKIPGRLVRADPLTKDAMILSLFARLGPRHRRQHWDRQPSTAATGRWSDWPAVSARGSSEARTDGSGLAFFART